MKYLKAKIVHDTKILVIHHPTENCVKYPEDEGSPLLKRRAPRLHRPYPPQPRQDARQSDSETE